LAAELDTGNLPDERFDLLIDLARTQVLAQTIHSDNYDLRLVGLLGFNGALIVVDFAIKDSLLGGRWWVPLVFLAISSFFCLWSPDFTDTASTAASSGDPEGGVSDLGPSPSAFFVGNREKSAPEFQAQLLADLGQTIGGNEWLIDRKKQHLIWAGYFLAVAGASGAIVAVGLQNIVGFSRWEIEVTGALAVASWHRLDPALASFVSGANRLSLGTWSWLRPGLADAAAKAGHLVGVVWRQIEEIAGLPPT
jgi:hypothetical protein